MNFKDNLKKLRKDNNLSQEELAEKLNVTRQSVSKWESGVAYPEMDKVIQICKMFNINIDDLLNKDIKEANEIKESKNNINKYIDDILEYVTKTVNVFSSLKFGGKVKCLFEQMILIGILVAVFAIIGSVGENILYDIIGNLSMYRMVHSIFSGIFVALAWIISIALIAHIFKVRYLDYYEIVDSKEEKEEKIEIKKQEKIDAPKQEKVIIRDEKHSEYGFIKGLLKVIVFFIKFIVFWIALSFVFVLVGLVLSAVLTFTIIKSGILFVGTFTMILSGIIITIILLVVAYNFILNRKNKIKLLGVSLLVSIILFGVGLGLFTLSIKNFTYIDDINNENYIHETYRYEMDDNLVIGTKYFIADYVVEDRNDIKIELVYTKYDKMHIVKDNNYIYIGYDGVNFIDVINNAIEDINNYEIVSQDNDRIIIHANKENIDKLISNYELNRKKY